MPENPRPGTILIADDEPNIRRFLSHELTQRGYHVLEASNGNEAIQMAREFTPDLIALDVLMPDLNGLDVTAVLRDAPATRDIPILIISAIDRQDQAFKLGASDYLTKPCNIEEVARKASQLIRRSPGRVLVVDDEQMVREMVAWILEAKGYHALMASSGEEALDIYRQEGDRIHLIVLDLVMPGMGGEEAFFAFREINPTVPILISSVQTHEDLADRLVAEGAQGVVYKPYRSSTLLVAVRRALGAPKKTA